MILFANRGRAFAKSDFGDFIPRVGMHDITKFVIEWKEKLSRFVDHAELRKNDHDISPSRYILERLGI